MKKFVGSILVVEIILSIFFSSVNATIANTNLTQLGNTNKSTEMNNKQKDNATREVDTIISDILKPEEKMQTKDITNLLNDNGISQNGIYVTEKDREYFLNLVNKFTNKNYIINQNGYLIKDTKDAINKEQNKEYEIYTSKIDELISRNKKTIISIEENYNITSESGEELLTIRLENDQYALKFDRDEELEVIILNKYYYNNEYSKNLLNKLLEIYYNNDSDFIELVDSQTIEELDNKINPIYKEEHRNIHIEENEKADFNDNLNNGLLSVNIADSDINEFKLMLASMFYNINEITEENIETVNINKNNGILLEQNSQDIIIEFINNHCIYTYSVDSNGYLTCDYIKKDNPYLEFKDVTEMDIELTKALKENIVIYLSVGSKYLELNDGKLQITKLKDNETLKAINSTDNNERAIMLNEEYFYKKLGYNIETSDRFVKNLLGLKNDIIMPISDTSKYGYMVSAQTVYAGPSNSNYATVGSVDPDERVFILGQSVGWYHIQYNVGSTGTQKSGFVPTSTITNIVAPSPVHEEILTGGYRYAKSNITVYSCDDLDIAVSVGTVFEGEGVTLIYGYGYTDNNKQYQIAYIEYSSATGTKRGYTYESNLIIPEFNTSVARITGTSPAYAGPDTAYVKIGGAYTNEYVSIISKNNNNDWALVEYNTASGRKRGFMNYDKMYNCNPKENYQPLPEHQAIKKATQQLTVYGGPDSDYANSGMVFDQEIISYLKSEKGYAYIEYSTTGGAKRGYVLENALDNAILPSMPNIPTYANFTKHSYGASGLGTDLPYYKIGNGENVAFIVFAQHGWEDAWAADGVELVKIASRVMDDLSNGDQSTFDGWTLYIIPYANPDGITNGYTNNGPGRCTVTTKIDMNRCWPIRFTSVLNISRNYTGSISLGATEAMQLSDFLISKESKNGMNVLVDVHGWYNTTYGDPDVGAYFATQFGFGANNNTYGPGYLATFGAYRGYKASLVELPMPSSSSDIINYDYSGRMSRAITNMLKNINKNFDENGTKVDEVVRVVGSTSVRLRSIPSTSGTVVTNVNERYISNKDNKKCFD